MVTTFGCRTRASNRPSWTMDDVVLAEARPAASSLSATSRSSLVSQARKTSPYAPSPIFSSSRSGPQMRPLVSSALPCQEGLCAVIRGKRRAGVHAGNAGDDLQFADDITDRCLAVGFGRRPIDRTSRRRSHRQVRGGWRRLASRLRDRHFFREPHDRPLDAPSGRRSHSACSADRRSPGSCSPAPHAPRSTRDPPAAGRPAPARTGRAPPVRSLPRAAIDRHLRPVNRGQPSCGLLFQRRSSSRIRFRIAWRR